MSFYLPDRSEEINFDEVIGDVNDHLDKCFVTGSVLVPHLFNETCFGDFRFETDAFESVQAKMGNFNDVDIVIKVPMPSAKFFTVKLYGKEVVAFQGTSSKTYPFSYFKEVLQHTIDPVLKPEIRNPIGNDDGEGGFISTSREVHIRPAPLNSIFVDDLLFSAWKFANDRFINYVGNQNQIHRAVDKQFRIGFFESLISMYIDVNDYGG